MMDASNFTPLFTLDSYSQGASRLTATIRIVAIGDLPQWTQQTLPEIVDASFFAIYKGEPKDWFNASKQASQWAWAEYQSIPPDVPRRLEEGQAYLVWDGTASNYITIGTDSYHLSRYTRWAVANQEQQYNIDSAVSQVWLIESRLTYDRDNDPPDPPEPPPGFGVPLSPQPDAPSGMMGDVCRSGLSEVGISYYISDIGYEHLTIPAWAWGLHQVPDFSGNYPNTLNIGWIGDPNSIGYIDPPGVYNGRCVEANKSLDGVRTKTSVNNGNLEILSYGIVAQYGWSWSPTTPIPPVVGGGLPPGMPMVSTGGGLPPLPPEPPPPDVASSSVGRRGIIMGSEPDKSADGWVCVGGHGCLLGSYPVIVGGGE